MKTTHETVTEVYEKLKADAGGEEEPAEVAEPVVETPAIEEPAAIGEPVAEVQPAGERQRAPDGKFTKGEQAPVVAPKPVPLEAKPITPPVVEQLPALKAPADWTPRAKEKWAGLPREVQEEAHRLHTEVKKTLQESAGARQVAEAFQRTVAPYEHMFRAGGRSPVEGVGWLVQQYAQLQTAPIPQRAAIVAGLIRDFVGMDEASIGLVASALEGKPAPVGGAPAAMRPEQIQQMIREEARRMAGETQVQGELKAIQDFEASEPEFLPNVTNQIAAIVTIAKKQGKPITVEMLKEAHQQALRMNPETAAILKQRDDAEAAKKRAAQAPAKAAAASGIKDEPGGPTGGAKPRNTREEVEFQANRLKGRARV